ncbi:hypothetical protein B0A69_02585 [Chryseobacterium shigense]|uniref:Uncharacterized protein n=1 Tax=Chryseobacterium shigense TaxID=297244 RepID=A0A1N7I8Q4_9FLAO|nr:hypothetical protein [Chryseobacterium shigense]PQA96961.1 hypothetical protein B0A69_02585 [Chryseobacterium shigense]SIS33400.1 hypothetical protein SAMN05421639_102615 [Chryseobacterium shigense]
MKNIAYIEIDTHAEIAQAFMDIMKDSSELSVDYYFSKKIKDRVEETGETIFLSDSSMILEQLKLKKYDLIIIGTVHRYFNTFHALVQKYNAAIIVHNINFSLASKSALMKSIFKGDVIYRLKLWWKEGLFYTSKAYRNARNLLVLDEELSVGKYKFLPLFYNENSEKPENKHFTVVIPGGVSQKRRDYLHVFETIQQVKTEEKFEFIFLGEAKDSELKQLQKLSQQLPENISIQYFSDRVSNTDFQKGMQKADMLWCPIRQKTEFFSREEVYGRTKMTGNLGDAIRYGKIAVFPKDYPSKLEFIIPEKENVIEQFKELKNIHFDFQKSYHKKAVLKKLEEVLSQLAAI